jgi:hypothetical protein
LGAVPRATDAIRRLGHGAEPDGDSFGVGNGRLRQLLAYGRRVYDIARHLGHVVDGRRTPRVGTPWVAASVFYAGLLRVRSFNALEPRLAEKPFLRLIEATDRTERLCCVDTVTRALRVMDLESVRALSVAILRQAERNKVFREGWRGALRYVAVDGWEPISSRKRHCKQCLVRKIKISGSDGGTREVEEYYHRYAVAMLIDPRFDLVLDFEPLLPSDLRPMVVKGKKRNRLVRPEADEGELTAATRLVRRVKQTFGWIDVIVGDSLYANGPFLTTLAALRLGAVIVTRKETDEPLRDALHIWEGQAPIATMTTDSEHIELWDCPDIETLSTFAGPIRVVRGRVTKQRSRNQTPSTWCLLAIGAPARRLTASALLQVVRARWHIENTAFHQWTTCWCFNHVFVHDARGIQALYWLFFAAFNLLTLFLYCRLRSYGRDRGKDVTRTISRLVDEMRDDLARFLSPIPDTG